MFEQVKLDYAFVALEPYIDALTVETHYSKHHTTYTRDLDTTIKAASTAGKSAEQILSSLDEVRDGASRKAPWNNDGGYYSHDLYFRITNPEKHSAPGDRLTAAIEKQFGSIEVLKEKLAALAVGQLGSDQAWLSANKNEGFQVSVSTNQDNSLMESKGFVPILGIDIWGHAYYLKCKSLRLNYVKASFGVLDWRRTAERYEAVFA